MTLTDTIRQKLSLLSKRDKTLILLSTSVNIFVIGFVLLNPQRAEEIVGFGLIGIFFASLLNASTLFNPIPAFLATFIAASVLPLIPLILVAATAVTIGESMAYLLGEGVGSLIGDAKWHLKLKGLFLKAPFIFLVIWIALPNPVQTLGQVFAGSVKYPFWKYILATFCGNLIWYTSVATAGHWFAGMLS